MDDNYEYTARKKELAAKYVDKMNKHENEIKRSLTSEQYDFFKSYGLFVNTSIYKDLLTALKDPNTIPSEYVSEKMGWLFDAAISSRGKDVIMYFADRLQEYAYSDSYGRRSFRVRNNGAYALKLSNIIRQYGSTYMCIIDEPLENILNGELPEEVQAYVDGREHVLRGCGYSGWQVAYALDQNNVKVEDAVRRIIMEENGSGMMTGELICGVLLSHRNDFHELLGKLLVAARLQEGLRQSICEFADP